jgi:Raf kinase inhibitor-like YbhB/YbcL family protein
VPVAVVRATALLAVVGSLTIALAACKHDGRDMAPARPNQTLSITTTATTTATTAGADAADPAAILATTVAGGSSVAPKAPSGTVSGFRLNLPWADGTSIEDAYTCNGDNRPPAFSWTAVPAGTVQLGLIVSDNDASGFVHWAMAGIDPATGGIDSGELPAGIIQARNGFGQAGWGGPCPPAGATHHYQFSLYALSAPPAFKDGDDASAAISAMNKESTAVDVHTFTYRH